MTLCGKFEFLRLPLGLCQGPDFFIHLIYDLFGLYKVSTHDQCSGYMGYLDDIMIYSRTENEHSSFFKEQIHYFGNLVSGMSILPLADKIEALMKIKPPTKVKEVRHFLGLTGYHCKFICNYADIAYPINCLTHKAQPFIWIPEYQASFNMLHLRLTNTPIVQLPDPNKPYLLFTYTNKFCYSGVLTQASTVDCNEAHMKLLTNNTPFTSDTLHDPPLVQTGDDIKLSFKKTSPTDIPQLEENLMSLPELTPDKVIKYKKVICFAKIYCPT